MDISVVRVPARSASAWVVDDVEVMSSGVSARVKGGGKMTSADARAKKGEYKADQLHLANGVYTKLLGNSTLVIVDGARINIIARSVITLSCSYVYASKFGVIIDDGKSISLITEIKGYPWAAPLGDGLMIAPIIERGYRISRRFTASMGEVLVVSAGRLDMTYILSAADCKLAFEGAVVHVNDDIAIYNSCGDLGTFAADLRDGGDVMLSSDLLPQVYLPSSTGVRYIVRETVKPAAGAKSLLPFGDYVIVTITRKPLELCVACSVPKAISKVVLGCGHIVPAHARCADAITKCGICDKPTSQAIVVRD